MAAWRPRRQSPPPDLDRYRRYCLRRRLRARLCHSARDQFGADSGKGPLAARYDRFHAPHRRLTDQDLAALLKRAIVVTLILGGAAALVIWIASGWRNAAMFAVGAAISAASIFEWQRLIRLFNAKLDNQKTPRGAATVIVFFVLKLTVFAALIYVSLKCFQGSVVALLCGLGLAMVAMAWKPSDCSAIELPLRQRDRKYSRTERLTLSCRNLSRLRAS